MAQMAGSDLTERQLKLGIWFAERRTFFKGLATGVLVFLNIIFWGYSLFGFLSYIIFAANQRPLIEKQLIQGGINWSTWHEANKPLPVEWSVPEILNGRGGTDFIVEMRNANPSWLVRFEYTMELGEQTISKTDFLLPASKKYVVSVFRDGRGTPNFSLSKMRWQKITTQITEGDYNAFLSDRLNFVFENIEFVPGGSDLPSRIKFTVRNNGAFNFWQARFIVLLWRGDRVIGVTSVTADRLQSQEKRDIDVVWFDRVGAPSRIEIIPDMDIFDESVYMPAGA